MGMLGARMGMAMGGAMRLARGVSDGNTHRSIAQPIPTQRLAGRQVCEARQDDEHQDEQTVDNDFEHLWKRVPPNCRLGLVNALLHVAGWGRDNSPRLSTRTSVGTVESTYERLATTRPDSAVDGYSRLRERGRGGAWCLEWRSAGHFRGYRTGPPRLR